VILIQAVDSLYVVPTSRRMKAAWLAYEEANLPILKQDKPGLKLSQYKDM